MIELFGESLENNIYNVNEAKALTLEMRRKAKQYETLANLAFENEVNIVKTELGNSYWLLEISAKSWYDEHHGKGEKGTNNLKQKLCEFFDVDDIEIVDVLAMGLGSYGYDVKFTSNNKTFSFEIPVMEKLNTKVYNDMNYGQLYLGYYKNECSVDYICSSYKKEEIVEAFKKFIQNLNI